MLSIIFYINYKYPKCDRLGTQYTKSKKKLIKLKLPKK